MDNELGRTVGLASNDAGLGFRPEEPLSRLWSEPAATPRTKDGSARALPAAAADGFVHGRARAIERDLAAGVAFELAELWRRLRAGEWRVRDTFATESRLYVLVEASQAPARRPASDAALAMIEQVLLGQSSKAVAIERRVSDSTVALAMKKRLRRMGLSCKLRAIPVILAIAARAACGRMSSSLLGRIASLDGAVSEGEWVISLAHPDFRFPKLLSMAERAVLLHLLDGKTYVQIATARQTSLRTVANQLASIFRKLGVSGYGETLELLLSCTFDIHASALPEQRASRRGFNASPASVSRDLRPSH